MALMVTGGETGAEETVPSVEQIEAAYSARGLGEALIETILSAAQCSAPISTTSKVSGASFNALKRKTNGMTEIAD